LAAAFAVCLEAPESVRYLLSYVCSNNDHAPWWCDPLRRLGWEPRDRLEDWLPPEAPHTVHH
jgi:hypothetical protein